VRRAPIGIEPILVLVGAESEVDDRADAQGGEAAGDEAGEVELVVSGASTLGEELGEGGIGGEEAGTNSSLTS
jgi:hypothetical protein